MKNIQKLKQNQNKKKKKKKKKEFVKSVKEIEQKKNNLESKESIEKYDESIRLREETKEKLNDVEKIIKKEEFEEEKSKLMNLLNEPQNNEKFYDELISSDLIIPDDQMNGENENSETIEKQKKEIEEKKKQIKEELNNLNEYYTRIEKKIKGIPFEENYKIKEILNYRKIFDHFLKQLCDYEEDIKTFKENIDFFEKWITFILNNKRK